MKKTVLIVFALLYCFTIKAQLTIREGKDAIYLFISNDKLSAEDLNSEKIAKIQVSRSINNGRTYKNIGFFQAKTNKEEFKRLAGEDILKEIMKIKHLKSEDDAWNLIKQNPSPQEFGLLTLNLNFLEALGVVFKDNDAKTFESRNIKYKIEYLNDRSKTLKSYENTISIGIPPIIEKPKKFKVFEADSSVVISWTASAQASLDVFRAEVRMQERANTPFSQSGISLPTIMTGDTIQYQWTAQTTPGLSYAFYLVPLTYAGMEGPRSDTIQVISRSFKELPPIQSAQIRDSLGGIFLSWEKLKSTELMSAILIERSKNPEDGYMVIDTIPSDSDYYIDLRILPNTLYHYRFRTLGIRQDISDPSADAVLSITPKVRIPEAPENVSLIYDPDGNIDINWDKNLSPEISGYRVFRALQNDEEYLPVSNLLSINRFKDTTIQNSRLVYKYVVKSLNFENQTSGPSSVVFGSPQKIIKPQTPFNIESYSEPGKITLKWKDGKFFDHYVQGYNIYRKNITEEEVLDEELSTEKLLDYGFKKINQDLITENIFSDTQAESGKIYLYAITAVDLFDIEGYALGAYLAHSESFPIPTPEIFPRSTQKGIEILWTDIYNPEITQYEVFVRKPEEKIPQKIGEIKAGSEYFIDTNTIEGRLYFYSIKSISKTQKSLFSPEKGVRR